MPTSGCGKGNKTCYSNTRTKNAITMNNKVDNILASSDHSGQSLAMKILLNEEIEMVAAKSVEILISF